MKRKRSISFILVLCMFCLGIMTKVPVYAVEDPGDPTTQVPGLCVHHPEHTEACSEQEGTEEPSCSHVHDENCGFLEGQPCSHVHDETCGYVKEVEESVCSYAVDGCPYCVDGWEWADEEELLTEVDGEWELALPGVNEENPLTREAAAEFLPKQMTATTGTGEVRTLELVWDLTAIPEEGAGEGEYLVTANLSDENYALTDEADKPEVRIRSGGAESLADLPSGTPPFPGNIVNGVSPNGTTINLFDYWIQGQNVADNNNGSDWKNKGINANHALLFGTGMNQISPSLGTWNRWTGSEIPQTKIVNEELVDGYPQLNVDTATAGDTIIQGRNGKESLAYLFDPRVTQNGKQSFTDVQGLLQVDEDGYYHYSSQQNYAVYYPETNAFTLYDKWGILPGGSSPNGQFFPFNEATSNEPNMNNVKSNDASINHYFGMTMSTRFIQQNDGYTDSTKQKAVTYEFTGDDDVWIFIDGKLVADLGGIHDAASVRINFATGAIYINNSTTPKSYLGQILGTGSDTLPNNTYHTLDFFYLERGNVDSNMSLKYNLVTIPESSIIKVDQTGDVVPGATFSLYDADKTTKIATGTTDANGEFVFLDDQDFPIQISTLYENSDKKNDTETDLILVEDQTPDGYRAAKEIELYFYKAPESEEVLLLSNSIWDEGAYAMTNVTATMPNTITLTDREGTVIRDVNLMGEITNNPLMFAVVFQKQDDGQWYPVYGDPIKGWTVAEDASWNSVLTAAKANAHQFLLASSGAYQAEIDELPGDVKTYYHICQNLPAAKYTIAYYYSEAKSLNQATDQNTYLVDSEGSSKQEAQEIDRVFSMNLYVTNIKNRLQVQKVDETGALVSGAEFALYKATDITVAEDGTVTIPEDIQPYDTVTTGNMENPFKIEGGGTFPNVKDTATSSKRSVLENGEYYLVEKSAPGGYKLNEAATHVIIDNTGVYVDAGNTDDGVSVLRGVGSIMKSMVQFAANDKIDTTLYGIKTAPVNGTYDAGNKTFTWSEADWNSEEVKHLQYKNDNGLLEYGLLEKNASLDELTFAWDTGWSMVRIRQCLEDNEAPGNHTDLQDRDITSLFSGSVIVRVQNQRVGNLRLEKAVETEGGVTAPENTAFTFNVTVKTGEEILDLHDYQDAVSKSDGAEVTVDDHGGATVTMHNGEYVTFLGLPYGAIYEVEETQIPNGYRAEATVSNAGNTPADLAGVKVTGTIDQNNIADPADAETIRYTNIFDGSTSVILTGKKTFLYGELSENQFAFTLEKGSFSQEDGCSFTDPETVPVNTDGTFRFSNLTFTKEGTYEFRITESLPQGVDGDHPISGDIRYDTHTAIATVTVTGKEDGTLESAVMYKNEGAEGSDENVTDQAAFTNYKVASLTVSKTVSGDMGDRDKDFSFTITLKDPQGNALTGSYGYTGGTVEGITGNVEKEDGTLMLDSDGKGRFTLKHGQSITIVGLPSGSTYEINEPDAEKDGYQTTITTTEGSGSAYSIEGTLSQGSTSVAFENHRDHIPNTGILADPLPWMIAAAFVLIGGAVLFLMRGSRRSKKHGR